MCRPRPPSSCSVAFISPVVLRSSSQRCFLRVQSSRIPRNMPSVQRRSIVRMHSSACGHTHSFSDEGSKATAKSLDASGCGDTKLCSDGDSKASSKSLVLSHEDAVVHDPVQHDHGLSQATAGLEVSCGCSGHSHEELPRPIRAIIDLRERPSVAALSVILLALGAFLPGLSARVAVFGCLALSGLPALAESGVTIVESKGREVGADTLMTLAAGAAVASGAALEGALLTTLYAASHAVEHAVTAKARRDLDTLRDLSPSQALRLPPDAGLTSSGESVPVSEIVVGDRVLVRAGEIVPCDGFVLEGSAFVAAQHLTGEAKPRPVDVDHAVSAGSRPLDASLIVGVSAVGAESTMARISRLVVSAQANRPRVTQFWDKYARAYARVVLILSAAIALLFPVVGRVPVFGEGGSVKRSLGFLVAASPCALMIGAPVAYLASLSAAARRGVLVKNGPKALDATANAQHIVFDKTGTLTTGDLTLTDILQFPPIATWPIGRVPATSSLKSLKDFPDSMSRVLHLAAELERGAVHPMAEAITKKATELKLVSSRIETRFVELAALKTVPGQGVEARPTCSSGKEQPMARLGRVSFVLPALGGIETLRDSVSDEGGLVVSAFFSGDEHYLLLFRDELRSEAGEGVSLLKRQGLEVSLLTGDSDGTAHLVSQAVGGFDDVLSNATPESKLERIRNLHTTAAGGTPHKDHDSGTVNGGVVMVGDGVNDAPALAAATVGIACGLTSATAVQAADVVLVRKDLRDVAWYVRKANATRSIVTQNLAIAIVLMLFAVVPVLAGAVPLWLAVTMHEGGTILVGLNGLRLLSDKLS